MAITDQLGGATATGMSWDVWIWQLKRAMKDSGDLYAFDATVAADPTDNINIVWAAGGKTSYGDSLSAAIKTARSKTDAQMIALYQAAANKTV